MFSIIKMWSVKIVLYFMVQKKTEKMNCKRNPEKERIKVVHNWGWTGECDSLETAYVQGAEFISIVPYQTWIHSIYWLWGHQKS